MDINKDEIIHHMCTTFRHDFDLELDVEQDMICGISSFERVAITNMMTQIYDHCFEPVLRRILTKESNGKKAEG